MAAENLKLLQVTDTFQKLFVIDQVAQRTLPLRSDRDAVAYLYYMDDQYPLQDHATHALQFNASGFARAFTEGMFTLDEIESAIQLPDGRVVINNVVSFISSVLPQLDENVAPEIHQYFVPIQVIVVSDAFTRNIMRLIPRVTL